MMDASDFDWERVMEWTMGLTMAGLMQQVMASNFMPAPVATQGNNPGPQPAPQEQDTLRIPDGLRYIYVWKEGQPAGPFSLKEFIYEIRERRITPETYIWKSGMEQWQRAAEVKDLSIHPASCPPPKPKFEF